MTKSKIPNWLSLLLVGFLFISCHQKESEKTRCYVSIRNLDARKNERVVGIRLKFISAQVTSMPVVPIGWQVSVINDPSWSATVQGSIIVGTAAVDSSFLHNFVTIKRGPDLEPPFTFEGEIALTTDFEHTRQVRLDPSNLGLDTLMESH